MNHLIATGLSLLLLAVCMKVFSGEQLDNWKEREILVDGYRVIYVYPEKAFFYKEPEKTAVLDGKKYVDIANIVYEQPFFARWKAAGVYFQYSFWNVELDNSVNSTEGLLNHFKKINEDGRFAVVEKRTLSTGDWVYISNQFREGYYQYFKNGYAISIDSSYSDDIQEKTRQRYSAYLKMVAGNLKLQELP